MGPFFSGSGLKIKWADQHIVNLDMLIKAFSYSNFYSLRRKRHKKQRGYEHGFTTIHLDKVKPLPEEIPLMIGDAIHNLHSALDLMYWEMVTIKGSAPPTRADKFPFMEKRQELIGTLNGGPIKTANGIIDLFVNKVRPYRESGGNEVLYALHDLDIIDKHKLIIPLANIARVDGIEAVDQNGGIYSDMSITRGTPDDYAIAAVGNLKITNNGKASLDIRFDKGQPFENEVVLPTLTQLSQLVAGIVETFENAM